jgi:hypothetical protein
MFDDLFQGKFRKHALNILNTFGQYHRIINCIEELSELQKALTKSLRAMIILDNKVTSKEFKFTVNDLNKLRENIINEMADVYLTIEETKLIFNINDEEIYKIMLEKFNRGVR